MPCIISLTGPSGCGKSIIIKHLIEMENEYFHPISMPKYTTRLPRKQEKEKGLIDDKYKEKIFVKNLPKDCDLVYEQYGVRYGLQLKFIYDSLEKNKSPIIIINDVRVVEDVCKAFGKLVKTVFVFREIPSFDRHMKLARERKVRDKDSIWKRYQKAHSIYRIYIENIYLFNHVILNFGNMEDLDRQIKMIVNSLKEEINWPLCGNRLI